jgi:hypothetical protein
MWPLNLLPSWSFQQQQRQSCLPRSSQQHVQMWCTPRQQTQLRQKPQRVALSLLCLLSQQQRRCQLLQRCLCQRSSPPMLHLRLRPAKLLRRQHRHLQASLPPGCQSL